MSFLGACPCSTPELASQQCQLQEHSPRCERSIQSVATAFLQCKINFDANCRKLQVTTAMLHAVKHATTAYNIKHVGENK